MASTKPKNFSWVDEGKFAAFGCPSQKANLQYLLDHNIMYLVTLSSETRPPAFAGLKSYEIEIPEFHPPTENQIRCFIDICEEAFNSKKAVGVHCRMGRGRTGVMAACYLVKFHQMMPQSAMGKIRQMRPGSIETYSQEESVMDYFFSLCKQNQHSMKLNMI